ncbi:MAG: hypothetical protein AAGF47_00145 [Planctomycetota bacterium]
MKTMLRAIGVLATLHLLLLVGGVGWVIASGRLDDRRWTEFLDLFGPTTAQRDRDEAAAEEQARQEAAAAEQALSSIALTAEQQIDRKLRSSEADRQTIQRMRREVDDLRRALSIERAELDKSRELFVAEREAFESQREQILRIEGDAQFQTALQTLMSMRPKQAYSVVLETINTQPEGTPVAVSYLNSLPPRQRAAVIGEFEKNDAVLAAELLERLRTRGMVAASDGA